MRTLLLDKFLFCSLHVEELFITIQFMSRNDDNMPTLVYVNVNDEDEGKDDKEQKDNEESFLSQVREKLCSSDGTSLVTKLFNMLRNESNFSQDVLNTANDKVVCSLEADNLDMSLSGFESATNGKEMTVDMVIKEQ